MAPLCSAVPGPASKTYAIPFHTFENRGTPGRRRACRAAAFGEGIIPLSEFDDVEDLQVGDEVEVLLVRLENDEGMVILSKERAAYKQNWEKIAKVYHEGGIIKGKVKAVVKGGLTVNIGVEAF